MMRRHYDPEDFNPMTLRNGWERRLHLVGAFINKVGATTLMLAVFVGWSSGWIPSVVTRMETKLAEHDAARATALVATAAADRRLIEALAALTTELRERNRRDRIRECAEIRDNELRRECLR